MDGGDYSDDQDLLKNSYYEENILQKGITMLEGTKSNLVGKFTLPKSDSLDNSSRYLNGSSHGTRPGSVGKSNIAMSGDIVRIAQRALERSNAEILPEIAEAKVQDIADFEDIE